VSTPDELRNANQANPRLTDDKTTWPMPRQMESATNLAPQREYPNEDVVDGKVESEYAPHTNCSREDSHRKCQDWLHIQVISSPQWFMTRRLWLDSWIGPAMIAKNGIIAWAELVLSGVDSASQHALRLRIEIFYQNPIAQMYNQCLGQDTRNQRVCQVSDVNMTRRSPWECRWYRPRVIFWFCFIRDDFFAMQNSPSLVT
jgi:hypothetical protein